MSADLPTDVTRLTQALIRCPSVTPAEGGALTLLENVLTELGFVCHRLTFSEPGTPDIENLYARIGSSGPNLCFAGHTDVVPPGEEDAWSVPPFAGEIRDGILFGRGAVDMKGAIACFVSAAAAYLAQSDTQRRGAISLLITGDEEGPAINGTVKVLDWLKQQGEQIDACIVGEPSNPRRIGDEIKVGRRGSLNGEIIVNGRQGHSAYPALADNPVPKLARIIDRLSVLPLDEGSERFERSNLEVTIISVPNTVTNVIPGQARAAFNVRFNDNWTRERLEDAIRSCCEASAAEVEADMRLTFSFSGDAFCTEPGPLLDTLVAAVRDVSGVTPALTTGGGTSDARFIKNACPVIEFGLVNATIHKVDEHVPVSDLSALTAIYTRFLERFFAAA
ncbi:Succinyl-diaminopimelate desuccinylase [Candidatus Filomicrobium marinum]|uniref:Succinyl-diaminopimelate desuccinylase n=1 Tax=Candidatus Filomicrobium marinum TaxID=1608628 RepID=A0A0D6JE64_9HYPH|nr:succinyl-diaminopimelate desuccinylase [Candidatus Filomicrobium marinum]CFX13432.1 Succinyl-diaminopimelate desuccinylase [Candidatus Filomicrobium marinum]CPR17606.1 Succinyl-diaminopimelate desuccinylase [Candidatus Filomicrobium marinum]